MDCVLGASSFFTLGSSEWLWEEGEVSGCERTGFSLVRRIFPGRNVYFAA